MISVEQHVTIRGPHQKANEAPLVVWPPPISENDQLFFQLCNSSEWLCRFVTGKRKALKPLGRNDHIEAIDAALTAHVSQDITLGSMADRRFKKSLSDRKNKAAAKPLELSVPTYPESADTTEVMVIRKQGRYYARLTHETLEWIYTYCSGGPTKPKRLLPQQEDIGNSAMGVTYSRTESCYICRGPWSIKRFRVQTADARGELLGPELYRQMLASQREAANREMDRQRKVMEFGDGAVENFDDIEDMVSVSVNSQSRSVQQCGLKDESSCGDGVPLDMSMDPFL